MRSAGKAVAESREMEEETKNGLTFREGQLVRLELSCSEVAAEEGDFVALLEAFLGRAGASQAAVTAKAAALQVRTIQPEACHLLSRSFRWMTCICCRAG